MKTVKEIASFMAAKYEEARPLIDEKKHVVLCKLNDPDNDFTLYVRCARYERGVLCLFGNAYASTTLTPSCGAVCECVKVKITSRGFKILSINMFLVPPAASTARSYRAIELAQLNLRVSQLNADESFKPVAFSEFVDSKTKSDVV